MNDLRGRNCLVTGASSGIGFATAQALANRGAGVWLLCRDPQRGRAAVEEVCARSGNPAAHLLVADLSSQCDIRRAALEFLDTGEPLHVLIHNAGGVFLQREQTADGIERTLAVNHLAAFLLTGLLLDRLRCSTPARVVSVSSSGHANGRIRLDDLGAESKYSGFLQYCNTKLANVMFTYELARRLEGSGVVAHCLHPGAIRSNLGMNNSGWVKAVWKLARPFFRSVEKGAETSVYLASATEVEAAHSAYWVRCRRKPSSPRSYDEQTAAALWRASEVLTGLGSA